MSPLPNTTPPRTLSHRWSDSNFRIFPSSHRKISDSENKLLSNPKSVLRASKSSPFVLKFGTKPQISFNHKHLCHKLSLDSIKVKRDSHSLDSRIGRLNPAYQDSESSCSNFAKNISALPHRFQSDDSKIRNRHSSENGNRNLETVVDSTEKSLINNEHFFVEDELLQNISSVDDTRISSIDGPPGKKNETFSSNMSGEKEDTISMDESGNEFEKVEDRRQKVKPAILHQVSISFYLCCILSMHFLFINFSLIFLE